MIYCISTKESINNFPTTVVTTLTEYIFVVSTMCAMTAKTVKNH